MNGGVAAGLATVAVFALAIGGWLYVSKLAPKSTITAFLIAGLGIGGTVGYLLGRALAAVLGLTGGLTGQFLGVASSTVVSALALVATLEIVIKGLHPKKAKPRRWHPWLALVLPTIVVAAGLPIVTTALDFLGQTASTVGGYFT